MTSRALTLLRARRAYLVLTPAERMRGALEKAGAPLLDHREAASEAGLRVLRERTAARLREVRIYPGDDEKELGVRS